jgi:hypothetical protein
MSMHKYLWVAPAALLLAGCSRQGAVVSAQGPTPEPVANVPAQQPYQRPMATQPAPAPNMYPEPQSADRTASGQPLYATQPAPQPAQPPLTAYGQPASSQPAYSQPMAAQPASEPAPVEPPYTEPADDSRRTVPEVSRTRTFDGPMIPAGTSVHVRLDESRGTKHDRSGERFYATLSTPIVEDGRTVLPAGTRFIGHLTESKPSGRLKGRAIMAVRLDAFDWRGRQYDIETSSIGRASRNHKRHNLGWIGGGAGIGAAIGAIAGGGEGALIGGAAGAGAGTAGAVITGKKQVSMRAETPLTVRLRTPVQL